MLIAKMNNMNYDYAGPRDGDSYDPHTGWGGFADHRAKKHFDTLEEQAEWYRKRREEGLPVERDSWQEE